MTSDRSPQPAVRWTGALLVGAVLTAAAGVSLVQLLAPSGSDLTAAFRTLPVAAAGVVASPFLAAILAALVVGTGRGPSAARSRPVRPPASPSPPATRDTTRERAQSGEGALQLLALLQQEGRLVDFLEEDLASYSDEQIGSAVRSIHEGCRTALKDRLALAPVLPGAEGTTVTVERGFDPAAVRITGNVRGEPPYRGVLRHPGWRSAGLELPERTGDRDVSILAPAEVEIL